MRGRLNSFQRTMVRWNELHPYSAVHAVQLAGSPDEPRLRESIRTTLTHHGLTGLELDRSAGTYVFHGGRPENGLTVYAGQAEPMTTLLTEMERQLNLPFPSEGRFEPFRFFVVPADSSFFLGLAYFHPIADAESIVRLLREVCLGYAGAGRRASAARMDPYPDPSPTHLRHHPGVLLRRLLRLPRQLVEMRRWHRPPCRDLGDFTNRLIGFSLDAGHLQWLKDAAAAWQLTVNDLLLALLLRSLSPLSPGRLGARRRRRVAVGCIVNLRGDLKLDSGRTFGLFLGSFTVSHAVPEGVSLRQLALGVRRQTLVQKRHRLYLGTPLDLGMARVALRFYSPDRRRIFYQKNHPLWGGLTNMNLNRLWESGAEDAPLNYLRAVSTGPATPLALSFTTVGRRANVSLSYRPAVFGPGEIGKVRSGLVDQLKELEAITPV